MADVAASSTKKARRKARKNAVKNNNGHSQR